MWLRHGLFWAFDGGASKFQAHPGERFLEVFMESVSDADGGGSGTARAPAPGGQLAVGFTMEPRCTSWPDAESEWPGLRALPTAHADPLPARREREVEAQEQERRPVPVLQQRRACHGCSGRIPSARMHTFSWVVLGCASLSMWRRKVLPVEI
ncbi:hypothetical protein PVAP13_5NG303200 [Panicum virgatum]|uniref:GIL1/IRKI C-terminal domain-containing protein n=1 Tax=Panicum virgatum TaxID=38727 RepID=A0A8T0RQR6_PANVG|nr:hypothetical protein PVAP13_5NG303200 [Panicum virgatum]